MADWKMKAKRYPHKGLFRAMNIKRGNFAVKKFQRSRPCYSFYLFFWQVTAVYFEIQSLIHAYSGNCQKEGLPLSSKSINMTMKSDINDVLNQINQIVLIWQPWRSHVRDKDNPHALPIAIVWHCNTTCQIFSRYPHFANIARIGATSIDPLYIFFQKRPEFLYVIPTRVF